ncbi:MAG: 3'-5' exonuclease [Synechococcus sp.]
MEDTTQLRPAPTQLDLLNVVPPAAEPPAERFTPAVAGPTGPADPLKPDTLLILDTETTGLDPEQDHCIEVGCILFDVASRSVLMQQSFLLPVEANAAEVINHIPPEISRLVQPWQPALTLFAQLVDAADVVVAHNAAFDRQWFGRGLLPQIHKPWLCTMEDIRWPADRQLRPRPSVRDLALAYGIPVWAAHRALTDCIYLAEVLARCDDLDQLLERGMEPRQLMRAQVSYANRSLAKEAGFRWNEPVPGCWSRRLSHREAAELPFDVTPVSDDHPDSISA